MFGLFATVLILSPWNASGQNPVTSAPPSQIVFVPVPNARELYKHPALPVLYVACQGEPAAKNLVTLRLNTDGTVIPGSRRACDNYFGTNIKNPEQAYRLLRPTVASDRNILYLGIVPVNLPRDKFYAATNNQEFAAVSLDEQGQPQKLFAAFRTEWTGSQEPVNLRYLPDTQRLFLVHFFHFSWCELGANHLPVSPLPTLLPQISLGLEWEYVPAWKRFYVRSYVSSMLTVFKLSTDGRGSDFIQPVGTVPAIPWVNVAASEKFRKIYVAARAPDKGLTVFSTTHEGRITGLPRSFSLGEHAVTRFDFKEGLLYGFTPGSVLRIDRLDAGGYPIGSPRLYQLACGDVRDAIVDEATGKVYVACSQPPAVKE